MNELDDAWPTLGEFWERDGELRDLVVAESTVHQWQQLLDWLVTDAVPHEVLIEEVVQRGPYDAAALLRQSSQRVCVLHVDLGLRLSSHFFVENEIEFDIDPREVTTVESFRKVLWFMSELGRRVEGDVALNREGRRDAPVLTWSLKTSAWVLNNEGRTMQPPFIAVPEEDLRRSLGLRFRVSTKAAWGARWNAVKEGALEPMLLLARELTPSHFEIGIFVGDEAGWSVYWTSRYPEDFNSDAIARRHSALQSRATTNSRGSS